MDPDFKALLLTLFTDLLIFGGSFTIWLLRFHGWTYLKGICCKKRVETDTEDVSSTQHDVEMDPLHASQQASHQQQQQQPSQPINPSHLRPLERIVYAVFGPSPQTRSVAGKFYLFYLRSIILFLGFVMVLCLGVLLPVNVTGHGSHAVGTTFVQRASAASLDIGSARVWAITAVGTVILIAAHAFLHYLQLDAWRARQIHIERTAQRVLKVDNLPLTMVSAGPMIEYLKTIVEEEEIEFVNIITDLSSLLDFVNSLREVQAELVMLENKRDMDPQEIERLQNLRRNREPLEKLVANERARHERDPQGLGFAYVGFKTLESARRVFTQHQDRHRFYLSSLLSAVPALHSNDPSTWTMTYAPPPSDIVWENVGVAPVTGALRCMVANAVLIFLVFFVSLPATIVHQLEGILAEGSSVFNSEGSVAVVVAFFSKYISTLSLFVINQFYSPFLMSRTVAFERNDTHSKSWRSAFSKLSFFLLINLILLPTLALGTVRQLVVMSAYSYADSTLSHLFSRVLLTSSGQFFMQYLIHATLYNSALDLLQIPESIYSWWQRRGRSPASTIPLQPWRFELHKHYATALAVFALVLVYSLTVPLLVPLGFAYFVTTYAWHRWQLANTPTVHCPDPTVFLEAVVRYTLLYLSFFEILLATFFFGQNTPSFNIIGTILTLASMTTLTFYLIKKFNLKSPVRVKWWEKFMKNLTTTLGSAGWDVSQEEDNDDDYLPVNQTHSSESWRRYSHPIVEQPSYFNPHPYVPRPRANKKNNAAHVQAVVVEAEDFSPFVPAVAAAAEEERMARTEEEEEADDY